jgi:amino acid adenylation domain-containing protein
MSICAFMYELNKLGFVLWQENGSIKYKIYNKCPNKDQILQQIKANKSQILNFLQDNNLNSPSTLDQSLIYKTGSNKEALSFQQEGVWFVENLDNNTSTLNIPLIFELEEGINLSALAKSIQDIISYNSIFRTLIKTSENGIPYQIICDLTSTPFAIEDIKVPTKQELNLEVASRVNHKFDLKQEYPIKVCFYELINANAPKYFLSIVIHHIAFDGWSINILIDQLQQFYLSNKTGTSIKLPILEIEYKDFVYYQRHCLSSIIEKQVNFWKNKLAEFVPLNLMTDYPRQIKRDYSGDNKCFELNQKNSQLLRALAQELNVSLASVMISAYCLMLKVFSNQEEIIIGLPIPTRQHSQIENLIGFFVNILPLRVKIKPSQLVKIFIKQVAQQMLELQANQDLPLSRLVQEMSIRNDDNINPIFQVTFEISVFHGIKSNSATFKLLNSYKDELYKVSQYDLSAFIDDSNELIKGTFVYASSLYSLETIQRFIDMYIMILEQISQVSDHTKLIDLNYLGTKKYKRIIDVGNDKQYRITVVELFEEKAQEALDSIALVYEDECITYSEFDKRSNQLAHFLRQIGVGPEVFVGIMLDRSIKMMIAIWAVLKAGGAYVPLDPDYPQARIKYILDDINLSVILTNTKLSDNLPPTFAYIIDLDESREYIDTFSHQKLYITSLPQNLAYAIYTSGSTGKPKGVMVEHKTLVNYTFSITEAVKLTSLDVVDISTSISFDLTVTSTISALALGAKLVIYKDSLVDSVKYRTHLNKHLVSLIKLVPSYFQTLPNIGVKKIILGGEKVNHEILGNLDNSKLQLLIDEYGPTEATVGVYARHLFGIHLKDHPLQYRNVKLYVLNQDLNPVPVGVTGELYIGGDCLARGYLNMPDLTAKQFIANPFYPNNRLYKTGDLVKYLKKGQLEYIGRNDDQIKIRGYRIEVGEIEKIILEYGAIKSCVIVEENEVLIVYYISDNAIDSENLSAYLAALLPRYMIPSFYVHLQSFPLTANNKIDKNALPKPGDVINAINYTPPKTNLEMHLCKIWSDLFQVDYNQLGIEADFFKLGGNSILAIRLVSIINNTLDIECDVATILEQKSIINIAKVISSFKNTVDKGTKYLFKRS